MNPVPHRSRPPERAGHPVIVTLSLLFVLLILAPYAAADGMIYIADRDIWRLQPEQSQLGAICYEDGYENLLLSVSPGSDLNSTRVVWIFPVPAAPEDVKVDVLKGYPRFTGGNLEDDFNEYLTGSSAAMVLCAAFPVSLTSGGAILLPFMVFGMAGSIQKSADIQVYDRVEKMGLTTEVVGATDAGALNNFLQLRGMDASLDGRELLDSYIGQNYTFVVTSVSDPAKFREAAGRAGISYAPYTPQPNLIGVFVRFPADRIYFPLKPTAVYGSRQVPVLLYVTGAVSPELYDAIRDSSEVTYYRQQEYDVPPDLGPFFNNRMRIDDLLYTKIRITAPSDRFTGDLWIDPEPPLRVTVQDRYLAGSVPVTAAAYVLFSMLASLIAGMIVFRRRPAGAAALLRHGLWNCGTLILFAVMTRRRFPPEEYGKRWPYVLVFYLVFAGLVSIFTIALSPALAPLVLIGWVVGLLSPLFCLGLLLLPVILFQHLYRPGAFEIAGLLLFSGIAIAFALLPVPLLIGLKRWLDPVPALPAAAAVPAPAEPLLLPKKPGPSRKILIATGFAVLLLVAGAMVLSGMSGHAPDRTRIVAATAAQSGPGMITITYLGGQDAGAVLGISATATSAGGEVQSRFTGTKSGITPLALGTNFTFTGSFAGRDHVVAAARFLDGSEQVILDTYV